MEKREWSPQDAKNGFSAVVAAAQDGTPQTVTKRGKPAAVVRSVAAYEALKAKRVPPIRSFVEHLLAILKDDGSFASISVGRSPRRHMRRD
jgi:prevent-host-death family protein